MIKKNRFEFVEPKENIVFVLSSNSRDWTQVSTLPSFTMIRGTELINNKIKKKKQARVCVSHE